MNKFLELELLVHEQNPECVMITEANAKSSVFPLLPASVNLQGYDFFCNLDATGSRGIIMYIKQSLSASDIQLSADFNESIWASVTFMGNTTLLLGCIYRSPSSSQLNNEHLCKLIREMNRRGEQHVLIVGDFNFPEIDWSNWHSNTTEEHPAHQFLSATQDAFLFQHILKPTRFREGQRPNVLDLVLTNDMDFIHDIEYLPPLGKSDHVCLIIELALGQETVQHEKRMVFDFNKGDYTKMRTDFSLMDWDKLFADLNCVDAWKLFANTLSKSMDENIPKRTVGKDRRKKIYMTHEAMTASRKKQRLWKRYLESKCMWDYEAYSRERNSLRSMTRDLCKNFELQLASEVKTNPKSFWRYVNSKAKVRTKICNLMRPDGTFAKTGQEKADILNKQFSSVFTSEDLTSIPVPTLQYDDAMLDNVIFTAEIVRKKLLLLKNGKSAGPDNFHPRVLKELADHISGPLARLFEISLREAVLPIDWKEANITALHKKGSRKDPGNYRPISLTSVVVKVMESVLRDAIVGHMRSQNLFSEAQHGFVPGRSCTTQLLCQLEDWTESMDKGEPVDVIYLDFKKAFDSVPHTRLIRKVSSFGIADPLLSWIKAFLSQRKQRVVVDGVNSSWASVMSGIPQGSVLGPTLFVMFVNDLPDTTASKTQLYADDAKIYAPVLNPASSQVLQQDLSNIQKWSRTWQLPLNSQKCKALHIGKNNQQCSYMMDNAMLENVTCEKDLGVLIDGELNFHKHISSAIQKANQMLGLIKRAFVNIDPDIFIPLYKALVRPHLEYCSVSWSPRFVTDDKKIEAVQRRATRLIPGMSSLSYPERLIKLELFSLHYRRERGDMIQVYKILHGIDRIDPEHFFVRSDYLRTRGHPLKFFTTRCKLNLRSSFFSKRVISSWNSLPASLVTATSAVTFKHGLDIVWLNQRFDIV